MSTKIAQVGVEIGFTDISAGYRAIFRSSERDFKKALADYFSAKYIYLLNSGTAAFYTILSAFKSISSQKSIILPAYTAPAMVLPVLKAGLKPVLCDISLKDFNLDLDLLVQTVTQDTLCIVPTHLFGIVNAGIESLKEKMPQPYIIEDCAQSFGSKIRGKYTGTMGDAAFLSFNRGKNLPTYGGGCVLSNSEKLAGAIEIEIGKLKKQGAFSRFVLPFKIMAFAGAVRPRIYGALYPIISRFKDERVPASFALAQYTNFQSGLGLSLFERIALFTEKRYQNGIMLCNGLSDIDDLIVPSIAKDTRPAFNRFPLLCKDLKLKERIEAALFKSGIDTSQMYVKPLHHIFDLGYAKKDFPNANYLAEHLLTLPVHSLVSEQDIAKMIEVIRQICSRGEI